MAAADGTTELRADEARDVTGGGLWEWLFGSGSSGGGSGGGGGGGW